MIILRYRDSFWYRQISTRNFPSYHLHYLCYISVRLLLLSSNMLSVIKQNKKQKRKSITTTLPERSQKLKTTIVERCKIFNPNTQIHDRSLSWFTRYYSSSSDVIEIRLVCSIVSFLLSVLWSIICLFFSFCVVSVFLRLATSDYNFGISKLFLQYTVKVGNGFISGVSEFT